MGRQVVSHVGIAVADIDNAIKTYSLITGDNNPKIHEIPDQKVKVAIFTSENSPGGKLELLTPTSDDSPIAKFISKKGEGLHHICIYVEDIYKKLEVLKNSGLELIDQKPRKGAEGNLIAFIHPKSTGNVLIELEQKIID
jgi:methylmalonyl-CoA/ethylmalonyl-CoA epimerase